DLTHDEIRSIEATAAIGESAPPGYMWVNPDDLAGAAAEADVDVDDPELLARAVQFCVNNNVTPEEMALMYELGVLDGEPEALPHTSAGLPLLPWRVVERKLENLYGVEPGTPWPAEAEQRLA